MYSKAFTSLFASAFEMTIQFDEKTMIIDGCFQRMLGAEWGKAEG